MYDYLLSRAQAYWSGERQLKILQKKEGQKKLTESVYQKRQNVAT